MRNRTVKALGMALALALPFLGSPLKADPAVPGSPLVGGYCTEGSSISGRGATFANNAHQLVFIPTYAELCGKGSVSYASTGSGDGKRSAINHVPTFAMSDEPLSLDEQLAGTLDIGADPTNPAPGLRVSPLHHIPMALGAITVPYNLGSCGIGQETLGLRSEQIGAIFTGLITNWADPLLSVENPALAACNKPIRIAVRSDGSGTTYAFKDFLSKRNPQFQVYKQNQLNTAWPSEDSGLNPPLRGNGNGGVAAVVNATDGAIGYVELSTAIRNGLTWARVDGPHRLFVSPANGAAANCDLAAVGATHPPLTLLPGWEAVSITDSPNPLAYPVCTFTYALVYNDLQTAFGGAVSHAQAQTLADYLNIAVDDVAQERLTQIGYGRLPVNLQGVAKLGLLTLAFI